MTNLTIALLALFHVYCIEIIVCFLTLKILKKFTNKNFDSKSTYIVSVRALHVVALIGFIYFIPLVALVICLAIDSLLIGPIILLIIGSTVFVTEKIIIPASENKYSQLHKKYYDKDSIEYQELIEKKRLGKKASANL